MNSTNNLARIFHLLIITIFLLGLSACGHKAPPFYVEEVPNSGDDQNVEFIKQESNQENDK